MAMMIITTASGSPYGQDFLNATMMMNRPFSS